MSDTVTFRVVIEGAFGRVEREGHLVMQPLTGMGCSLADTLEDACLRVEGGKVMDNAVTAYMRKYPIRRPGERRR